MSHPPAFNQSDLRQLHALIRQRPLATLVWIGPQGLTAHHLPFDLDPSVGSHGALVGHVSRSNPLWREAQGREVLLVFHGPQAYVSPSWYPSKADTHRAVPTWNYVVVHAHGELRTIDDPRSMRSLLECQTTRMESHRPEPWRLEDAPVDFVEEAMSAIVGLEVVVHRLDGKWKLSQNRSAGDRAGVVRGLTIEPDSGAHETARWVIEATR